MNIIVINEIVMNDNDAYIRSKDYLQFLSNGYLLRYLLKMLFVTFL